MRKTTKTYQILRPFDDHRRGDIKPLSAIRGSGFRKRALLAQGFMRESTPSKPHSPAKKPLEEPKPPSPVVSLNSASLHALQELTGVGEHRAELIVEHRPYLSRDEALAKQPFLDWVEGWDI